MDPVSSTPMSQEEGAQEPDLPPEPEEEASGDRVSITGVHGTVAHFEMSYSPPGGEKTKFGPPLAERIPSALYLAAAAVMAAIVAYAYGYAPPNSRLFGWVVEGDRNRPISADILTIV